MTFLAASVNGAISDLLTKQVAWKPPATRALLFVGLVVTGAAAYGWWRAGQEPGLPRPSVAIVPAELDRRPTDAGRSFRSLVQPVSDSASTTLVVWPETACRDSWVSIREDRPKSAPAGYLGRTQAYWEAASHDHPLRIGQFVRSLKQPAIIGLIHHELGSDGWQSFNSAAFFSDNGTVLGMHDKFHLVPCAEYKPFSILERLSTGAASAGDCFSHGRRHGVFPVETGDGIIFHVVPAICYDICFPHTMRQFVITKPCCHGPVFIVNIASQSTLASGGYPALDLQMARWRAIEARRAMVKCTRAGYSAIIDGNGRVVDSLLDGDPNDPRGVLIGQVPLDDRFSFYMLAGDWLPIGCCVVTALLLVWPRKRL